MTVHIAAADMDVELADFMKETTQTIGTGAYALDGVSEDAMQSFVTGVGSGNQTVYSCVLGTSREVGVGTVTAGAPNTISRDFILASTNGGLQIDWGPGVKIIHGDVPAALLEQIVDFSEILTSVSDDLIVLSGGLTLAPGINNLHAFKITNADGEEVFRGRVSSGGDGVLQLLDDDGNLSVILSSNQSSRGSLELNGFEVYPLGEYLQTSKSLTGTSVDFTVRGDARRITVLFGTGCSSNGTSPWLIRLGDSGGVETTGYDSTVASATGDTSDTSTAGFRLQVTVGAAQSYIGEAVLTRFSPTTHVWQCKNSLDGVQNGTGQKTLSAEITTVRITTTNGTDAFDGGTVNVLVE